jgi:hypothetical protein
MRNRIVIGVVLVSLTVASGCGDDSDSASEVTTTQATTTASTDRSTTGLIGSWHRAQTCAEMLAAFQAAGLAESHVGWLQGNFFAGESGPTTGDPCAGARGPLEHTTSSPRRGRSVRTMRTASRSTTGTSRLSMTTR